jgi:hypothetical protein
MKLPTDYTKLTWQKKKKVREQYIEEQNNKCYYCEQDLDTEPEHDKKINWLLFPKNFLMYPVHLHHSHETNMTIGVVHSYCNAVLWQYEGE